MRERLRQEKLSQDDYFSFIKVIVLGDVERKCLKLCNAATEYMTTEKIKHAHANIKIFTKN